jgi:uncharacterized protein with FMN-binding domain
MWVVAVVLIILIFVLIIPFVRAEPGRREIMEMEIADVDFKNLRDGTFDGKYKGKSDSLRDVSVEVKISSGVLTKIKVKKDALKKERDKGKSKNDIAVEAVFDEVIKQQSLKVDLISGAALTCKTHLKAVENALEKAQIKEAL